MALSFFNTWNNFQIEFKCLENFLLLFFAIAIFSLGDFKVCHAYFVELLSGTETVDKNHKIIMRLCAYLSWIEIKPYHSLFFSST